MLSYTDMKAYWLLNTLFVYSFFSMKIGYIDWGKNEQIFTKLDEGLN